MKEIDYLIMGVGAHRTITARSERAKKRTPEPQEFPDNAGALEFVRAGVKEGYRFSGRELVDREYKLVRYGYFVKVNGGQLVPAGQDWGPPDPVTYFPDATSILSVSESRFVMPRYFCVVSKILSPSMY